MSLKHNTLWNLAGTGLPFLIGAATIPYLLGQIGVEAFGILTLIWALIGYFSLFDLGLGRALTQKIASRLGKASDDEISQLAKSGLVYTIGAGLVGGVILALIASPLGERWLHVNVALQSQVTTSFFIAALGIPLATLTIAFRGISEAYEDFGAVNRVRILLGAANFGLPAVSVMLMGPSLVYIVVTLIAARLAGCAAQAVLAHRRLPEDWMRRPAHLQAVKNLLSFGAWMTVSNVLSSLMATADRFVIAALLGAGMVAYHTVPFEAMIRLLIVPAALTSALFPRLSSFLLTDRVGASALYLKCMKLVAMALAPMCLAIAIGSYWGLTLWLGQDFASKTWLIASVMSVGIFLNGVAYVPSATIQAAGDAKTTAILNIIEFLLYAPLLFLFLNWFGVIGAALAWVFRVGLDLALLLLFANRLFRTNETRLNSVMPVLR